MTDNIQRRFERFHAENPHVLDVLELLATEWFETNGVVGVGMLWENMRWRIGVKTKTEDTFKLNDHYRSRYARLMIERHPEWIGRIRTRALTATVA